MPVRRSPHLGKTAQRIQDPRLPKRIPKVRVVPIAGRLRNHNAISQQTMNFLTDEVWNNSPQLFTPRNLRPREDATAANLEHLTMPMVHPTTRETKTAPLDRYKYIKMPQCRVLRPVSTCSDVGCINTTALWRRRGRRRLRVGLILLWCTPGL